MTTEIIEALENGILMVGFNRPSHKNAITTAMYARLAEVLGNANDREDVRVIVLHGSEVAFCSGNDVADFAQRPPSQTEPTSSAFMKALLALTKPVVAAVNGPAVGIGATMLLHCDFVYAGTSAFLSFPFVKLGLCPEFASSAALPDMIGLRRAAELLMLGERCAAQQAETFGLVNAVLPPQEVLPKALAVARTLAGLSQPALRTTKFLMGARDRKFHEEHRHEELRHFARLLQSPEAKAAFQVFLTRKPSS